MGHGGASYFALLCLTLPYRLYNGRRFGAVVGCWTADCMGHGGASNFALPCLALPCFALPCHTLPCRTLPCLVGCITAGDWVRW